MYSHKDTPDKNRNLPIARHWIYMGVILVSGSFQFNTEDKTDVCMMPF